MSAAASVARAVVAVSASTLPRSIRERYREQWLADLRDAAEVGLSRAQIAAAALAFAMTTSHPWPERRALEASQIRRRSRIARSLVLSAALLGLSQYASLIPARDVTGMPTLADPALNPAISSAASLPVVYAIVAPVLALIIVSATRGIARPERLAAWLLAVASCAPLVQVTVDSRAVGYFSPYLSPGSVAYFVAVGIMAAAVGLLYRARTRPATTSPGGRVVALLGGVVTIATISVGVALASAAWSHRVPLVWTDTETGGPARLSNPYYAQWLSISKLVEAQISTMFIWWAIAGVVLGVLVALVGILWSLTVRQSLALSAGALCLAALAEAGVLIYLDVAEPVHFLVALSIVQLLSVAGRYTLVIATVVGVGLGTVRPRLSPSPGASSRARRASRRAALP